MSAETLDQTLRATRWGSLLAPDQLARVVAESSAVQVAEGGYLCRNGEPVDAWYGVIDGFFKMIVTTPDGKSATFTNMPAGSWF
nr:cyclic nucleotide-binding domain-containing protein [Burkholderiaceae bacterium]